MVLYPSRYCNRLEHQTCGGKKSFNRRSVNMLFKGRYAPTRGSSKRARHSLKTKTIEFSYSDFMKRYLFSIQLYEVLEFKVLRITSTVFHSKLTWLFWRLLGSRAVDSCFIMPCNKLELKISLSSRLIRESSWETFQSLHGETYAIKNNDSW